MPGYVPDHWLWTVRGLQGVAAMLDQLDHHGDFPMSAEAMTLLKEQRERLTKVIDNQQQKLKV